jgi:hypothetical protein
MLTALAVGATNTSVNKARRVIQYEVAKLAVPPVPAALTLIGPNPTASMPSSQPFNIIGTDGNDPSTGTACGGVGKPAIGTETDQASSTETATQLATDARNTLINAIPSNRLGNYTGVDGCTPDVQNVEQETNSLFSTVSGLNSIVHDVQNSATQTAQSNPTVASSCTGITNCISSLGTDANPKVTVVDGDLTLSGTTSGAGILLVTGTLTYSGNFSFDGLVMVIGSGHIIANGGGSGQFNGGVVIANIGNNSGCATNSQPCYSTNPTQANLLSQMGSPTLDWSGGGGNGIQYDTCALQLANNAPSYTVIARREITY